MTNQDSIWNRLALVFGSALIVAFFSVFFFFNEGPALSMIEAFRDGTLILMLFELGVWYSLALAPFLWIVERYRVSDRWGLFLAGTAAGFFIEGLIIPVFYFELPFSLVWVSMSWHPLVCIMSGWWVYQRWLRQWNTWRVVSLNIVLGLVWGAWATWPVGNPTDLTGEIMDYVPTVTFAFFAFSAAGMLLVGNLLVDRLGAQSFRLSKGESWGLGFLCGALFILIVLSVGILAAVLPAVLGVLWLGLRRSRLVYATHPTVLHTFSTPVPLVRHLTIFFMPLAAAIAYGGMATLDLVTGAWVLGIPLSLAGLVLLVLSLWFLYRKPTQSEAA